MLLKRLRPIITSSKLIPDHQFGFRQYHSTTAQVNWVYSIARKALEDGQFCTAVFPDIWHPGLLHKIKDFLPYNLFKILESYLSYRYFFVREKSECTKYIYKIESGVPQASVWGPVLYTLYTSDLPLSQHTTTATFADDTAIMAVNKNPNIASSVLQQSLNEIQEWMKLCRIMANVNKSVHITITLSQKHFSFFKRQFYSSNCSRKVSCHTFRPMSDMKLRSMYWLLTKSAKLSLNNKILI